MNVRTIVTLLGKEYTLLFRNKIFVLFSGALLFVLIGLYHVLPAEIPMAEPAIAVYSEVDAAAFFHAWDEGAEAIRYERLPSAETLIESVQNGDQMAGMIITEKTWQAIMDGRPAAVTLYTAPGLADEHVRSMAFILEIVFSEMVFRMQGSALRIAVEEIFVGEDIMQSTVPFKDQMIPLLVTLLLVMEVFSLGISLVEEKESRNIKAVLAAPVGMGEFLFAKNLAGISVICGQILLFLAAAGALGPQLPAVVWAILAGAALTTGVSAVLAAFSNDMMSLISKGVFVMIVMVVPLFGVLFPGMLSSWMRVMPTYMLADSLSLLINRGAAGGDVAAQLGVLSVSALAVLFAGVICIREKVQCQ
jgi:ABC-2 type transport system permease protein